MLNNCLQKITEVWPLYYPQHKYFSYWLSSLYSTQFPIPSIPTQSNPSNSTSSPTMKEIINLPGPSTKLIDSPIPTITDDQVLIKVVVSGSNPKDWKVAELANDPNSAFFERYAHVRQGVNQGDDIAGVVVKVGKNVVEFKVFLSFTSLI